MRRLPPVHTAKRLQTGRGRHQPKWLVQDVGEEGGAASTELNSGNSPLLVLMRLHRFHHPGAKGRQRNAEKADIGS